MIFGRNHVWDLVSASIQRARRQRLPALVSFAAVSVPKAASGVLQLLVLLLLARQLSVEELGIVSVCISGILLGDAVLGAALDTAVIRLATAPLDGVAGVEIQKAGLVCKLAAGFALLILSLAAGRSLSDAFFDNSQYAGLIGLAAGALAATLALRSAQTYFQIEGRFHLYGLADWTHSLIKFGGVGLLIASGAATPARVLLFYLMGPLTAALVFLRIPRPDMIRATLRFQAVRMLLGAAGWLLAAALVGTLTARMDLMMVSAFGGAAEAGRFAPAQQLVAVLPLIGGYLGIVFAPRIMPLLESGRFLGIYVRFQLTIGLIAAALYAAVSAALPWASRAFLPSTLHNVDAIAVVLLMAALAGLISFPWTVSLLLFLAPKALFAVDLIAIPILFLTYRHFIYADGALGAAKVTAVYAMIKLIAFNCMAWFAVLRYPCAKVAASPAQFPSS